MEGKHSFGRTIMDSDAVHNASLTLPTPIYSIIIVAYNFCTTLSILGLITQQRPAHLHLALTEVDLFHEWRPRH